MPEVINGSPMEWYIYERNLKQLVTRRIAMFGDPDTFWGRNHYDLCVLSEQLNFPEAAYHEERFLPNHAHRAYLLKRKYLNRLRQQFMKWKRQGTVGYYNYKVDIRNHPTIRHINFHRQKHGLPELTDHEIRALNVR